MINVLTPFLVGHLVLKVKQFYLLFAFNFSQESILECGCNLAGTEDGDNTCNDKGQCNCKCDVTGLQCDTCEVGHQGFPDCHGNFHT